MLPRVDDVTSATQQTIQGNLSIWRHRRLLFSNSSREYLAAKNPQNKLVVFERNPISQNWQADLVNYISYQDIDSAISAWSYREFFLFYRDFIACKDSNDDLLLFKRSGTGNWSCKNISQLTSQKISGAVTHWIANSFIANLFGEKFQLAGISASDELILFSKGAIWRTTNITDETGQHVKGELTSWVTKNGSRHVPHIAATSTNNDLLVFWLSVENRWKSVNVTEVIGTQIYGGLCSWQTKNGPYTVEHVAGKDREGNLWVFWWSPQAGDWRATNVTRYTCEQVQGIPAVYQSRDGNLNSEILITRKPSGVTSASSELMMNWWNPVTEWQAINLSEATGLSTYHDAVVWISYSYRIHQKIELVAFQGEDNHLKVISYDKTAREMVKTLVSEYETLKFRRGMAKNVMAILWDWHDPLHTAPLESVVEQNLFGAIDSVNDYFVENSNGHFSIRNQGIVGWYDAVHESGYYQYTDSGDSNGDGFENQYHVRYKEAIHAAYEDGYNFAQFDSNQDDILDPQELGIVIVTPGGDKRGFICNANEREYPNTIPYRLGGLEFSTIVDAYAQSTMNVGMGAHELSHLLLGHGDMYFELPSPYFMMYAAGAFSLLDQHVNSPHIDPFAKLKYGWISPRLILKSGVHQFSDIETSHKVWALVDYRRNYNEYFLIENRWPGSSYDRNLPDRGLGVWHIMEDPAVYTNTPCPPNMEPTVWVNTQAGHQWSRMAIRMIRPFITAFRDDKALWDGSDADTGYDLLSNDPDPTHAELRWGDGTPSGFAIRSISTAGQNMSATIEVPF